MKGHESWLLKCWLFGLIRFFSEEITKKWDLSWTGNNHCDVSITPPLDAPAPSPAVSNGGGCVPDSNESPAVSNPALAHAALDLFSSLPAPSSVSSTKTTVRDNTLYKLYSVCSVKSLHVHRHDSCWALGMTMWVQKAADYLCPGWNISATPVWTEVYFWKDIYCSIEKLDWGDICITASLKHIVILLLDSLLTLRQNFNLSPTNWKNNF